jgi:DNA-binding LytR/AlgR family response regulator
LKPFSFERFLMAVNKVDKKSTEASQESSPNVRKHQYFRVDGKNVKVYLNDILYIEGLSNYIKIILQKKVFGCVS